MANAGLERGALTFRPAAESDEAFLFELFLRARRDAFAALGWPPEQLEAFLRMQHRAQLAGHRAQAPSGEDAIVLLDGVPAGRLFVDRTGPVWQLVDVCVREPGQGLGTRILTGLCAQANAQGRAVSLHVAHDNPARRLYARAGFVEVGGDAVYLELRYEPAS